MGDFDFFMLNRALFRKRNSNDWLESMIVIQLPFSLRSDVRVVDVSWKRLSIRV